MELLPVVIKKMIKTDWYDVLYKFGRVIFGKKDEDNEYNINDDEESSNDEIVNDPIIESIINEPINDIEFTNKRDLCNFYGFVINTIPNGFEIKMKYMIKSNNPDDYSYRYFLRIRSKC